MLFLKFLLLACLGVLLPGPVLWASDITLISPREADGPLLTLESVFNDLEKAHPLLKRSRAQKMVASGKLLKALGKFEPKLVNDWELERLVKGGKTVSVGMNDSYLELMHPSGIKGFAGFRSGIGDVEIADLAINTSNQPLMGIVIPLLRGFATNPANAELQKSSLADKQAQIEIEQTRQDLYLGASTQYWNWVAASRIREIHHKALGVAQDRVTLMTQQTESGARPKFDAVEARQELQRRKDLLIQANREVEQEQYKLALFIWDKDGPSVPENRRAPEFPPPQPELALGSFEQDRKEALSRRPEIKQIYLESEFNKIDLDLAENSRLPSLELKAEPTRKPGEFVLGLGYYFGAQLTIPFLQREARGEILKAQGEADRLKLLQRYRIQKVNMDIDNARSAIIRSRERAEVLKQSLDLARELEKGEQTRLKLGATNLLIVNIRERDTLKANEEWVKAMADYQKSLALYQWGTGKWTRASTDENHPNPESKLD